MTQVAPGREKQASPATMTANAAALAALPFADRQDFEDARRGLVAEAPTAPVTGPAGRPVTDLSSYGFEATEQAPPSVHPSLWRQARLNAIAGLFEVTARIYQVRGMDISNMSIIEGDTGLIVIDPPISTEVARAGMDLYRQHRGDRPVVAVIHTHTHVDHYGGVAGVVDFADVKAGKVRVYAPAGFMEHAVSENVYAGTAMSRRSQYQYGIFLPHSELGQVDLGLGKMVSTGTITLFAPTDVITENGTHTIDGVQMEFQLTPGTEAPAEMNFYLPALRALCGAENTSHTLHNLLTLRGAEVRDPRIWARYLDETIALFGDRTDVLFASHHWPTWGTDLVKELLADQRDMYQFLHDQTLRLINHGYTPMEIAETVTKLPPGLDQRWYTRGYYGSISHNVRAVYQRYLGFYDGNPATLNPLAPVDAGTKYVAAIGGADKVLAIARDAFDAGEYRWAAQLLNHLIFVEPEHRAATDLQADTLEQLGYQCENGTWRCLYLMGAHELRHGVFTGDIGSTASPDTIRAMPVGMYFDYLGIRLNGDKAAHLPEAVYVWNFTDLSERYTLTLRNAALTWREGVHTTDPAATIILTKQALDAISVGENTFDKAIADSAITIDGDPAKLTQLLRLLDDFELMFNIVTP